MLLKIQHRECKAIQPKLPDYEVFFNEIKNKNMGQYQSLELL